MVGTVCVLGMNCALLRSRPQRNRNPFASFWSVLQQQALQSAAVQACLLLCLLELPEQFTLHLCMTHYLCGSLKTHEESLPAILTSILFDGLQQASSALHVRRVFNHEETLSLCNWYWNYDAAIAPRRVRNLQKWRKKKRFSTKAMSHCSKESWLKCWAWSLAVHCRNHIHLITQFLGESWNTEI